MATYRFALCDVFTRRPLCGNALAVFTDARGLAADTMQSVARETNLSETTFVLPAEAGGDFRVRIFTPARELPFAGHPVIGTAAVLGRGVPLGRLTLETGIGPVAVDLDRQGGDVAGAVMEQPEPSLRALDAAAAEQVSIALGLAPRPVMVGDNGLRSGIVPVDTPAELAALAPDRALLHAVRGLDTLAVYALADGEVRVRVFAPWSGVDEDPGTGSAAGPLAAHLVAAGLRPPGLVRIRQGVEIGRPSEIEVIVGDGAPRVGGAVAIFGRGSYELSP